MSSTLRTLQLIDLCAPSIDYDSQVKAACSAFDNQMYEIIDETGQVCFIPNIMDLTDSTLVDILAWQFHVDFYDQTRDLEFRKNLVQMAIQWHITKGTYALVQKVLDTYWPGGARISEWFEYYNPLPPGRPPPDPPPGTGPPESPIIVPPVGLTWHDRYRFRIYIDKNIIDPSDEEQVLLLIEHYKPISRWCEGLFRPTVESESDIGWTGMMLRFIYRESAAPTYYTLDGPTTATLNLPSAPFTVQCPNVVLDGDTATVTPHDSNARGLFIPTSVLLTPGATPTASFTYTPRTVGTKIISTTNDLGLTDPAPITVTVT